MIRELEDRYGRPPSPVRRLLAIAEIKRLAQKLGVSEIVSSDDAVKISFDMHRARINTRKLVEMVKNQRRLKLTPPAQLLVETKGIGQDRQLQTVKNVLRQFA